MSRRFRFGFLLLVLLSLGLSSRAYAADVLENVPRDAMGFVYVRDLSALDANLQQLSRKMEPAANIVLTPQAMLLAVVGRDAGLDVKGDLLFVVLASEHPFDRPPLCAWLPVNDYDRFAKALGGKPDEQVTIITVLGEDLLCAHHGKWAVVMDPDQRPRMNDTLAGRAEPLPQVAAWLDWLRGNDAVVMAMPNPACRSALRNWLAEPIAHGNGQTAEAMDGDMQFGLGNAGMGDEGMGIDDIFGRVRATEPADAPLSLLRRTLQQVFSRAGPSWPPWRSTRMQWRWEFAAMKRGGARLGLRMNWPQNRWTAMAKTDSALDSPAISLHRGGEFTVSGAGMMPPEMFRAAVEVFTETKIEELRGDVQRAKFDDGMVARFREACGRAAGDVIATALYHAPSLNVDGVYTNQFLAVRVASADVFAAHVTDAMRIWNELNQSAKPRTGLVFDSQKIEIGGRSAMQHSLDFAASEGISDSPELRQSMEKFFGPDRKLHLFVVPVDSKTVLLAQATLEQTAAMLKFMANAETTDWTAANVATTNRLLPQQADWRFFISAEGYSRWLRQEREAAYSEVIGAQPPGEPFPAAPPVGLAGGFGEHELWIEAAVPAATLDAAGAYLSKQ